jgi:D-alanyl-D-alanine carboxypeptidase
MPGRFAVICLTILFFSIRAVSAEEAHPAVEKRLESLLPKNVRWALVVVDMKSGEDTAELGNALEEKLVPASLVKLFTTGAVLDYAAGGASIGKASAAEESKGKRRGNRKRKGLSDIRTPERLHRVLRDMNVHSRNTVAQNLAVLLGERRFGPPGTRYKGTRAVCAFLNTFDLPAGEATIADGSGLRRENRVSVRYMARYLSEIAKKPWFGSFRQTLPRPGLEGTVKRIGYTDRRFRVKTGHLDDVFALAGYGVDANGRDYAFAFIVNVPGGGAFDRRHSRGEVMRLLAGGALQ